MALDSVTGDLYFGWFDGRGDSTFTTVNYFAAVIPAEDLDSLVNKIPYSNPQFVVPAVNPPCPIQCITPSDAARNKKAKAQTRSKFAGFNLKQKGK